MMETYKDKLSSTLADKDKEELMIQYIPERITNNHMFVSSMQLVVQFLRNKIK